MKGHASSRFSAAGCPLRRGLGGAIRCLRRASHAPRSESRVSKGRMPESGTSGSVGARGRQRLGGIRPPLRSSATDAVGASHIEERLPFAGTASQHSGALRASAMCGPKLRRIGATSHYRPVASGTRSTRCIRGYVACCLRRPRRLEQGTTNRLRSHPQECDADNSIERSVPPASEIGSDDADPLPLSASGACAECCGENVPAGPRRCGRGCLMRTAERHPIDAAMLPKRDG